MTFLAKPVSLLAGDTTIFACPAGQAGSIHGLVFSNVTGTAANVTIKLSNFQDGTTTVIAAARNVPINGEFTWPRPINMQQGDVLSAVCSGANLVVAVYSAYLNSVAPAQKGFRGRGIYSVGSSYEINDIVTYNGSAWLAIANSIGSVPPSANWMLLVTNNSSLSSSDINAALGYTPYNGTTNPNNYVTANNPTLLGVVVNGLFKTKIESQVKTLINATTATTVLDLSVSNCFKVTIAATTQFAFSNATSGTDITSFMVITLNDATAGRAVSWPVGVKWAGGALPPRTTAAAAYDVWSFYTEDAGTTWIGSLSVVDAK
jgi:hypothetical protein